MTAPRSTSVVLAVASRGARRLSKTPALALPPIVIPLFMFIAITRALSNLSSARLGYYDYGAFELVFALCVGAVISGVFAAVDLALDYESGVGARLMLATPRRLAIAGGYLAYGLGRGMVAVGVISGVVLATGVPVRGSALDVLGVVALALLLNLATTLYGMGIALRLQTATSGSLIFIPAFMLLFLTPALARRDHLSGWLRAATAANPVTRPIEAGRALLAGQSSGVATGFAVAVALVALAAVWAVSGMRAAERGSGGARRIRFRRARRRRALATAKPRA